MHSTAVEGNLYEILSPNDAKADKNMEFTMMIKYKDIKEINLKVGSNGLSTYKLD